MGSRLPQIGMSNLGDSTLRHPSHSRQRRSAFATSVIFRVSTFFSLRFFYYYFPHISSQLLFELDPSIFQLSPHCRHFAERVIVLEAGADTHFCLAEFIVSFCFFTPPNLFLLSIFSSPPRRPTRSVFTIALARFPFLGRVAALQVTGLSFFTRELALPLAS